MSRTSFLLSLIFPLSSSSKAPNHSVCDLDLFCSISSQGSAEHQNLRWLQRPAEWMTHSQRVEGKSCPLISQGRPWVATFSERKGPLRASVWEKPEKGEGGGEELERRFSLQIPDPEHYPAPTPPLLSQELVIEEAVNPRPGDTERPLCEAMMMGRLGSLGAGVEGGWEAGQVGAWEVPCGRPGLRVGWGSEE